MEKQKEKKVFTNVDDVFINYIPGYTPNPRIDDSSGERSRGKIVATQLLKEFENSLELD